jgi:uncharacterized small protein (DUF1192 family)
MNYIFEALRDGDHSIVDTFVEANALWPEILHDIDDISVDELAERLGVAQMRFERIAGERYLGKMLCGLSGFTHLYSCQVGLEDNIYKARKLRDAFAKSYCSVEVKHTAREAAERYGVEG